MFFDRYQAGERAVLVHINFSAQKETKSTHSQNSSEFKELVLSSGATPCHLISGSRAQPHPRTFIGSGKLEELARAVKEEEAEIVMFNHDLSPSQERNLEAELKCRVLGRTGLILDIFAQRARTHEGKLQVELAQLEHLSTRLVRGWTHLERQKGGIGLRGPGETQLETDRRLLRARIKSLNARLAKVRTQRDQGRRARKKAEIPTVSVVGYTNAGKSTLFNQLTSSNVYAQDQLFATLDPTMRELEVPSIGKLVLADTVGFIKDLPHNLVDAFRATLEEVANATLLVHVIDAADHNWRENIDAVETVLAEIGAHELPVIRVFNKIDLLQGADPRIDMDEFGLPESVWLSAQTGEGCDQLVSALTDKLLADAVVGTFRVPAHLGSLSGSLRASLHRLNAIQEESYDELGNMQLSVRLSQADWNRVLHREGIRADQLENC